MMQRMFETMATYGLPALFLISFCASTLLPLGSEWLLVIVLLQGTDPTTTVLVATLGNTLGSGASYLLGRWGGTWLVQRLLRIDAQRRLQAEHWFKRFGSWALLLAWLPVIGDPLCLAGGVLKTPPGRFFLLVATGKGLRYLTVAVLTLQSADLLG